MSMYVTIMYHDLLDSQHKCGEVIELSRMVLKTEIDSRLYPVDCIISWDSEEFEADVKWLQENGVRGHIILDLEGGEFVRYKFTDEGVEKAAGRVYFSGDRELQHGPLMVSNEDIEISLDQAIELSDEEKQYLLDNIEELKWNVAERIMERRFMDELISEARCLLASREGM